MAAAAAAAVVVVVYFQTAYKNITNNNLEKTSYGIIKFVAFYQSQRMWLWSHLFITNYQWVIQSTVGKSHEKLIRQLFAYIKCGLKPSK